MPRMGRPRKWGNSRQPRKSLQDKLAQVERKADNLTEILAEEGKESNQMDFVKRKLEELQKHSKQIKTEIDNLDFEINGLRTKIVHADTVRENFKVFKHVYDELTLDEKYDLLHLLIKKIVYIEDASKADDGKKRGRIRMDLWELPAIGPSKKNSATRFAERRAWRPFIDDFRTWLIQKAA